jgi:SAM-dependent methyltransferase
MDIKEYKVKSETGNSKHPWELARLKVVSDIISRTFVKNTIEKNTILDIGCGDGFFLNELSKILGGFEFIGIDTAMTPDTIQIFEQKYQNSSVRFHQNLSNELTMDKKIDMVLLLDVIEHIDNEKDFLRSLTNIPGIHANTLFVITVPAYQNLFCNHDIWLGHYRRYSRTMLDNTVKEAGFTPKLNGYFFASLLLPRIITKMIESLTKPDPKVQKGTGDWRHGFIITQIVKTILLIDYKISKAAKKIGLHIPGLSTFSICTKR